MNIRLESGVIRCRLSRDDVNLFLTSSEIGISISNSLHPIKSLQFQLRAVDLETDRCILHFQDGIMDISVPEQQFEEWLKSSSEDSLSFQYGEDIRLVIEKDRRWFLPRKK